MTGKVTVLEEARSKVSVKRAIRIWIGRFVVDYIETFIALAPAQLVAWLVTPQLNFTTLEEAKLGAVSWIVQLIGPAVSAWVSAGRRGLMTSWPSIRRWLLVTDESR